MYIKDLTKEQAIKLACIAHVEEWIEKDTFDANYYPYDPDHYSDAYEAYTVYFYGKGFGDRRDKYCVMIYNTLDTYVSWVDERSHKGLPLRNQQKLFKAMQEMGLEPNDLCYGGCYTQIPYEEKLKQKCPDYPNCKSQKSNPKVD